MSNSDMDFPPREYAPQGYALSGKIMLSAIIILFTVVILIVCFHIYARWFLQHHRPQPSNLSRNLRRRRHRRTHRTHFIFTSNPLPNDTIFAVSRGLDSNVLKSIPVFTYSSSTSHQKNDQNGGTDQADGGDVLECAVCLSEFEENEIGRILPKCKHSFHVECIDMWFHSHSTCPLCRTPVTPETTTATESSSSESATVHELTQIVIDSSTEHDGSGSNQPCTSCRNEGSSSSVSGSGSGSSSSSSSSVSPLSIEVRKTEEILKSLVEETAGQGIKSPGSRMLSLKRILSRERRMSSMSNSLSFCSYVTDNIDHDKDDEENQVQAQIRQPR